MRCPYRVPAPRFYLRFAITLSRGLQDRHVSVWSVKRALAAFLSLNAFLLSLPGGRYALPGPDLHRLEHASLLGALTPYLLQQMTALDQ
jgi:hypothetical protein